MLICDRFGTYSVTESITAGTDLEMPGPTRWRGEALDHAVSCNKFSMDVLDERVTNVLKFVKRSLKSGIAADQEETTRDTEEDRALLRKLAADSIVLLKNERNVLPFKKDKTVSNHINYMLSTNQIRPLSLAQMLEPLCSVEAGVLL